MSFPRPPGLSLGGAIRQSALVVADDAALATLLDYHLTKEGYEVCMAADAQAAALAAEIQSPALLVIDTDLPDFGVIAVSRAVRSEPALRSAPILALLGKAEDPASLGRLGLVATGYLAKPFSLAEFTAAARRCDVFRRELVRDRPFLPLR